MTIPVPFLRPIELGTVGQDVTALKRALIRWNYGEADGIVVNQNQGAVSVSVLKTFQKEAKLTQDGVMGPETYAKLTSYSGTQKAEYGLFDAYGVSLLEAEAHALQGAYANPFRAVTNLGFDGYDQGVDFYGNGLVYAAGPGRVNVSTTQSGWPGGGAICYTLSSGKAAGKCVYFCENVTPLVGVGDIVHASTAIAVLHAAYPHCETGWCYPGTDTPLSQPESSLPSYYGCNFGDFLRSLGETRAPVGTPEFGTPLAPGWPTW